MTLLGDRVAAALELVGVTEERVATLLGPNCGCKERRQLLNNLDNWARRVLSGRRERAAEHLTAIVGAKP